MYGLMPFDPMLPVYPDTPLGQPGDYLMATRNKNNSVTIRNFHENHQWFMTMVITSTGKRLVYWPLP